MNEQLTIELKNENFLSKLKKYNILIAIILAITCNLFFFTPSLVLADVISTIFIKLLKFVSMPIIFLSIISTISGMKNLEELQQTGSTIFSYTIWTTTVASFVALLLFLIISPTTNLANVSSEALPSIVTSTDKNVLSFLLDAIPSNILQPFVEGNILGVFMMAILISFAILSLPQNQKESLHTIFSNLNAIMMQISSAIIKFIPIAIWAFAVIFLKDVQGGFQATILGKYLTCVVLANLVQAFIVLPIFLKANGISPINTIKNVIPAITTAFWSKSSSATLPVTINCVEENLKIDSKLARFSLSLCTTINMNACAAFILTTVLFISTSYGITFTPIELITWVFIAVIAAVGNAGVPMGCYFLSCALLSYLNVPLQTMGVILPFYLILDMLETAINVWSDICVTAISAKKN